ncbi:MAG: SMC family ATPase [Microthrixaceae bacterium]
MRPRRLEVEGFAAFRERVVLDFDGVEVAALVGPTGAGKSSLIDAVTFALYGGISRYDNTRSKAPAINVRSVEARVRFDFEVDGVGYSVARRMVRNKAGASVRDARLERGETVLGGSVGEVDAAVESLLGMRFEDFTRTVVLPQGQFARLLHESGAERRGMFVRLLGAGVYSRIGTMARDRSAGFGAEADGRSRAVEALGVVSDPDVDAAKAVVSRLLALRDEVQAVADRHDRAARDLAGHDAWITETRTMVERLSSVDRVGEEPIAADGAGSGGGIAEVMASVSGAEAALASSETAEQAARRGLAEARERRDAAPALDRLTALIGAGEERDRLVERVRRDEADLVAARRAAVVAAEQVGAHEARLAAAREQFERCRVALDAANAATAALPSEAVLVEWRRLDEDLADLGSRLAEADAVCEEATVRARAAEAARSDAEHRVEHARLAVDAAMRADAAADLAAPPARGRLSGVWSRGGRTARPGRGVRRCGRGAGGPGEHRGGPSRDRRAGP